MNEDPKIAYLLDIKSSCIAAMGEILHIIDGIESWGIKDHCINIIEELVNIYNKADSLEWEVTRNYRGEK